MYTLYSIAASCSTGITVLMERLNLQYQIKRRIDESNYTDIVPTGKVPALVSDSGQVVVEGGAIVQYLLEKHENNMLPKTLEKRAEFYQWLHFCYATVHPAYSKLFFAQFKVEVSDEIRIKLLQTAAEPVSKLWEIINQRYESSKFIMGDKASHMDYMIAIYASWNLKFKEVKIELGKNTLRAIKEVMNLPEFKKAFEKEGAQYKF